MSSSLRRIATFGALTAVITVVLAFLALPIVALVTYQPVHDLLHAVGSKVATDAMLVSLKTNAIAFGITIALGTPFAYALARSRFTGRSVVVTLIESRS